MTPGIRLEQVSDDQSRVATPKEAHANRVDYIVVGRPITKAKNPLQEYRKIRKDFLGE